MGFSRKIPVGHLYAVPQQGQREKQRGEKMIYIDFERRIMCGLAKAGMVRKYGLVAASRMAA